MNPAPSFQFYMKDWLTDPAIRDLNLDERGRYIDVLARTHLTDHPGVCTEDEVRTWAGYTPAQWKQHRAAFARLFTVRPDGTWIQESIIKAREAQRKRHEHSSKGGFLSAARPRDSQGHFVPGLDEGLDLELDGGPGTPASPQASAVASPTLKKNQTTPAAQALPTSQEPATPNGAANEPRGLQPIRDVVDRTISREALLSKKQSGRDFTDDWLDLQQVRFSPLDVRPFAAQIRDEMNHAKIENPRGLLVYRCREALRALKAGGAPKETP